MSYPVVIHKDRDSDYGVTVPDLPGCFTAGSTIDEALAMAREAIELYLEYLTVEGPSIPAPSSLEVHKKNADYNGGTWALVAIDLSKLQVKAKRINITMPERVLDAVDRYARKVGETRSGVLVQAVTQYINRTGDPGIPGKVRGRKPKDKLPTKES